MSYLDTRDLYERQCELQEELKALEEAVSASNEELNECQDEEDQEALAGALNEATAALEDWKEEYQEELNELNDLENEIGGEWMHGETLIPEDEFKDYAMDLADDLHGRAVRDAYWPFSCIDWDQAADNLRSDYSSCEYQGVTYFYRS